MSTFNIQIVCDLNIDKYKTPNWRNFFHKSADILCIISLGRAEEFENYMNFIKDVCENYSLVILVPGDTEFFSYKTAIQKIETDIYSLQNHFQNLKILNNTYVDIDYRTRIFGSILWSHIKSDFSDKKLPVNSVDFNENCGSGLWINRAHFTSLYEIDKIIRISTLEDKDLIILTHYGPSMMCV